MIENKKEFKDFVSKNNLQVKDEIVLLTKQNAEKIEKLIADDDDYFLFSKIVFEYCGFDQIKNNCKNLFNVIRAIDVDNNSNVWRYKKYRESFINMISYINEPKNKFFEELKQGDITLPDKIVTQCGPGLKSLSSKVCKFLCDYAFQKDNYYINDSTVRHVLLNYLDYYKVDHQGINSNYKVDNMNYQTLYCWLSKLHKARNEVYKDEITKNELDHILWYCYKSFVKK